MVQWTALRCRFDGCRGKPSVILYMPMGCALWGDQLQALCEQHALKSQSHGPIVCIAEREEEPCPWNESLG